MEIAPELLIPSTWLSIQTLSFRGFTSTSLFTSRTLTAVSFFTCIHRSHNPVSFQGTYMHRKNDTRVYTSHSSVVLLSNPRVSLPYRCDISVCYKPDSSTDWRLRKSQTSAQIQPLNPTFCSLLCLPIVTFSGALPWDCWPAGLGGLRGKILCSYLYALNNRQWLQVESTQEIQLFFISAWCLEAAGVKFAWWQPQTTVKCSYWKHKDLQRRGIICRPGWPVIVNIMTYQRTWQTKNDKRYNICNAESSSFSTKQSFTVVKETVNVSLQRFQFLFSCYPQ